MCFASKDHNNNVKGSQGRNGGRNKGKSNQKPSEGLQGREIHLVQNNEGRNHQNRNDNKFQELRVINQYDNNQQDPRQGRDSYRYDDSEFSNKQNYRNYNQHPIQVAKFVLKHQNFLFLIIQKCIYCCPTTYYNNIFF